MTAIRINTDAFASGLSLLSLPELQQLKNIVTAEIIQHSAQLKIQQCERSYTLISFTRNSLAYSEKKLSDIEKEMKIKQEKQFVLMV